MRVILLSENEKTTTNCPIHECVIINKIQPTLVILEEHLKNLFAMSKFLNEQLISRNSPVPNLEPQTITTTESSTIQSDLEYIIQKKLELYNVIFEKLMTLLKWKGIEYRLRTSSTQISEASKLFIVMENIKHLCEEAELEQIHLEEKVNQLYALQQIEAALKES